MATYNTNATWSDGISDDFFAFMGTGQIAISSDFGNVEGAIRKYDMEDAVTISMPASTLTTKILSDVCTFNRADISNNGVVVSMGSRFSKSCSNFVNDTFIYFGMTAPTAAWTSTTLGVMFSTEPTAKLLSYVQDSDNKLNAAGLQKILGYSTGTGTLTINNIAKNFDNAKVTNVFGNGDGGLTNPNRATSFLAGDLIYFPSGIQLTFTVQLVDSSGNYTNSYDTPDYVNSTQTISATNPLSAAAYTQPTATNTTTTIGTFTATTTIGTTGVLTKTYLAPLLIKVVA